jgi:hypothetical protein
VLGGPDATTFEPPRLEGAAVIPSEQGESRDLHQ